MRVDRRSAGITLVMLMLVGGGLNGVASSAAPRQHAVQIGALEAGAPSPRFNYLAYYPERLQVHRGDRVRWQRPTGSALHTVTFNSPYEDHRAGILRRDEIPNVSAIDGTEPTDPTCGVATGQPACILDDPDEFVTNGWTGLFDAVIDLPVGEYDYYCTLHAGTNGMIEVVDDAQTLPTPEEIAAQVQDQIAADTAEAVALFDASQEPRAEVVGDHVRWYVKAGDITPSGDVAILRMMPDRIEIAPGDEMRAVAASSAPGRSEMHTVSFPGMVSPLGFGTYLDPACDPDDPRGGLPGIPGQYPFRLAGRCPPGMTMEGLIHPYAWQAPLSAPAGVVLTRTSVHDSGFLPSEAAPCIAACDPWTGERLPFTFDATFPLDGSFTYACYIHGALGMTGAVVVSV